MYLVKLKLSTADAKDGIALCRVFGEMVDDVETLYGCIIVYFCCDNDGGSQAARKMLVKERPWLFGLPCCAHQVSFTHDPDQYDLIYGISFNSY